MPAIGFVLTFWIKLLLVKQCANLHHVIVCEVACMPCCKLHIKSNMNYNFHFTSNTFCTAWLNSSYFLSHCNSSSSPFFIYSYNTELQLSFFRISFTVICFICSCLLYLSVHILRAGNVYSYFFASFSG